MIDKFKMVRKASAVTRFHTSRVRSQSLAEHCHGVAEIILAVRPGASAELLVAALRHDVYELYTGDVPAPAKWAHRQLAEALERYEEQLNSTHRLIPELDVYDGWLLKWADMAELVLFSIEEVKAGNLHAAELAHNGHRAWSGYPLSPEDRTGAADMERYINEEVRRWMP